MFRTLTSTRAQKENWLAPNHTATSPEAYYFVGYISCLLGPDRLVCSSMNSRLPGHSLTRSGHRAPTVCAFHSLHTDTPVRHPLGSNFLQGKAALLSCPSCWTLVLPESSSRTGQPTFSLKRQPTHAASLCNVCQQLPSCIRTFIITHLAIDQRCRSYVKHISMLLARSSRRKQAPI